MRLAAPYLCLPVFTSLHRLGTYGHRAFDIAGLTKWNRLPDRGRHPNITEAECIQTRAENIFVRTVLARMQSTLQIVLSD